MEFGGRRYDSPLTEASCLVPGKPHFSVSCVGDNVFQGLPEDQMTCTLKMLSEQASVIQYRLWVESFFFFSEVSVLCTCMYGVFIFLVSA